MTDLRLVLNLTRGAVIVLSVLLPNQSCKSRHTTSTPDAVASDFISDGEASEAFLSDVLFDLANSAVNLRVAEFRLSSHINQCFAQSSWPDAAKPLLGVMQGIVVDGAGGDLCFVKDALYYCGKEGARAAMSSSIFRTLVS